MRLLAPDEIGARIDAAIELSPAEETEIVWIESWRGAGEARRRGVTAERHLERTLLARVIDLGRMGSFRTGDADPSSLEMAIRQAVAQSRTKEKLVGLPHLPADDTPPPPLPDLWDPTLAEMDGRGLEDRLREIDLAQGTATLSWTAAHVSVFNSRGLRRQVSVTATGAGVRTGRGAGAGRAANAARDWNGLDLGRLAETASRRRATGDEAAPPARGAPLYFSPEAAGELIALLNRSSLTASAYADGGSFLREHLGVQVFDRRFDLIDDGSDRDGLPFPFDLEGTVKRRVDFIVRGTPKTPALDQRQAAQLGLPPTGHAISGNDARAENLFVPPGEEDESALLAAADGGLWIGWIDGAGTIAPDRVQIRAAARGVRRIENGALGAPVPDLVLQGSLLRALAEVGALGVERTRRLGRDGYTGCVTAPGLVVGGDWSWRPL